MQINVTLTIQEYNGIEDLLTRCLALCDHSQTIYCAMGLESTDIIEATGGLSKLRHAAANAIGSPRHHNRPRSIPQYRPGSAGQFFETAS